MGPSLLSYRPLGIRQGAALEAALPSLPSLFRDGGCHPQSWTDEKRDEFELLQGAMLEASLKCARKQFLVGPTLLTSIARESPWVRMS